MAQNPYVAALDPDDKVNKTTNESFASISQEVALGRVDAMPYAYLLIPSKSRAIALLFVCYKYHSRPSLRQKTPSGPS